MRRFRFEPRLLTRALLCIAAIGLPSAEVLPDTESAIPLIAAAMDVYPEDRRLQGAGMSAAATASSASVKLRTAIFSHRSHIFLCNPHRSQLRELVVDAVPTMFRDTDELTLEYMDGRGRWNRVKMRTPVDTVKAARSARIIVPSAAAKGGRKR